MTTPRLAGIRLHPIKSLDPVSVSEARIGPGGGLERDRAWALYSVDGRWVNGKRTAAMHLIRASYPPDVSSVTLSVPGDRRKIPARTFAFPAAYEDAAEWFSVYFEQQIIVRYSPEGFPDDTIANGPTVVSTASLQRVSEWFLGLDVEQVRRRFRTTLEVDAEHTVPFNGSLPAFWEDMLFGADERSVVRFRIGDVRFEGSNPCARCPVPARDPQTGEEFVLVGAAQPGQDRASSAVVAQHAAPGSSVPQQQSFQKRFTELRRQQLPPWAPRDRFDHFYRLATNTRVASTETGKLLRLGEPLLLG